VSDDLRHRVVRAIGASGAAGAVAKILSLLSTLVLVRILSPSDFGMMATATTVIGFIAFFNEVGIGAAIIQRERLTNEEVNGCFGIALALSVLLSVLTFVLSWPASGFMGMRELQPVLAVLGLGFLFAALNTVHVALLRRELRLQSVAWIGLTAAVVQPVVAIPLAAIGWGHWALVTAFFAGQIVTTAWYWRVSKWRPTLPFSLRAGRPLLGYGLNITYSRVLWHLYMNADKLIIGKVLGVSTVGIYDVSRSLASLPTSQITGLVTSIASPVFSKVQGDALLLRSVFLRFTRGLAYLTAPTLIGIAVTAPELVEVLLGPKWSLAVLPLQALCVSELVAAVVNNLQAQLLVSTGHASRLVRFTTLCAVVMPVAIGLGAWHSGLVGVAIAWACVYPALNVVLLRDCLRLSAIKPPQLWSAVRHPLLGALVMAGLVEASRLGLHVLAVPPLVVLVTSVVVGAVSYLGYLVLIDRSGLSEIRQVLADLGVPNRFLDRWPLSRGRPLGQPSI
jgi:O-antigen/teichoic acid export membrane protein